MATSVDQSTSKSQPEAASNGPSKHAEYSYVQGQPQPQPSYMSGQSLVDAYMPSYYTPYLPYPAGPQAGRQMAEAWSPADSVPYMAGGYNMPAGYGGAGMYGQYDYSQHPGYGWFAGGEFGDWGQSGEYYAMSGAEAYMPSGEPEPSDVDVKGVERSMNAMGLGDTRDHHGGADGGNGYAGSRSGGGGGATQAPLQKKPVSWAGIASQPASHQPGGRSQLIPRAPLQPGRAAGADIGSWDARNSRQAVSGGPAARGGASAGRGGRPTVATSGPYRPAGESGRGGGGESESASRPAGGSGGSSAGDKLMDPALYNPRDFDLSPKGARFFIIKSYSEDDIHRSIKYSIWCSTEYGNKRLDAAWREREGKGSVFLLFSVNGSGHFCGMAQMMTAVDYHAQSTVWTQNKWKGQFEVKWIYVKDVPNSQLRHIRLENNEGKPVTNSRDTQEVMGEKGLQVLRIIHQYRNTTSIFDDFGHYEKRQEEDGHEQKTTKPFEKALRF